MVAFFETGGQRKRRVHAGEVRQGHAVAAAARAAAAPAPGLGELAEHGSVVEVPQFHAAVVRGRAQAPALGVQHGRRDDVVVVGAEPDVPSSRGRSMGCAEQPSERRMSTPPHGNATATRRFSSLS